jgi:serine/threonine protein kinase
MLTCAKNILIKSTPPEVWVKLGDFGLSKRVEDGLGISATLKGTMGFIAPELYGLTPRTTDYATDIWGLGEIAFQMLTKKPAFRDLSLLYRYAQELAPFSAIALHEQNVSTAAVDFILQAMTAQAASRLTASDALGHAWMLTFAPELPNLEELVLERKVSIESNNVSEPSAVWTSISEPPRQHLPKLEPEPCSHLVEDVGPLMSTSSGTAPPVPKYPARPEHIETTLETYHTDIPKPIERRDPDTPPTIACPHCADYAGECCEVHELQRHAKRAHAMVRTVWICFDASPDKSFLARCRRCRLKKRYDAYHHAAVQ